MKAIWEWGGIVKSVDYFPYKLIDDYQPAILDNCHIHYELFADDIGIIKKDDLLYPRIQLDGIILQKEKDKLQKQINKIDDEIDSINNQELHPRTANNVSKIILAMAELLQWDLSQPYADETNGKIREVLERQGNKLSKDTIALWLKQAFEMGK